MNDDPTNSPEEIRPCPVCGTTGAKHHPFSEASWRVVSCLECGMVYLQNPPAQLSLGEEFAWEKTAPSERTRRRQGRRLYYLVSDAGKRIRRSIRGRERKELTIIKQHCPSGGSVLDIGCGGGRTLRALAGAGCYFRLFGIEPSPALAKASDEICRAHGGKAEHATALEGLPTFPADELDLVVMRSYLEHEVHAAEVLRETIRVLKPGSGKLLIKVPNAACWSARLRGRNWPGVRHPDHVNYFTPHHLQKLLRDCGFEEFRFEPTSLLPTSDNLWVVVRCKPTK